MSEPCLWRADDDGVYFTACGQTFQFNDGSATENGMKFCGYCGAVLHDVPFQPDIEDEDES